MLATLETKNTIASVQNLGSQIFEGELIGPPEPTHRLQRISHLDTIRGIAVMGILMSNIPNFGGCSIIPPSSLKPTFSGPHAHLNYILFILQQLGFSSKMRGLLAMIFGAGALLLVRRVEARHGRRRASQIFYSQASMDDRDGLAQCVLFVGRRFSCIVRSGWTRPLICLSTVECEDANRDRGPDYPFPRKLCIDVFSSRSSGGCRTSRAGCISRSRTAARQAAKCIRSCFHFCLETGACSDTCTWGCA
jgi:hypothetical protein